MNTQAAACIFMLWSNEKMEENIQKLLFEQPLPLLHVILCHTISTNEKNIYKHNFWLAQFSVYFSVLFFTVAHIIRNNNFRKECESFFLLLAILLCSSIEISKHFVDFKKFECLFIRVFFLTIFQLMIFFGLGIAFFCITVMT